jgi:hypothetical protein
MQEKEIPDYLQGGKTMKYEEVSRYEDKKFKRVVGVNRVTFKLMIDVLDKEYRKKHMRGRSTKLSVEDMLLIAMEYWYEKRTYEQIAASYGLAASNVYRTIRWIEDVFVENGTFEMPSNFIESPIQKSVVQKVPEASHRRSSGAIVF